MLTILPAFRKPPAVTLVNLNLVRIPAIAPYALDVLASTLAAQGVSCQLLDLCLSDDPLDALRKHFSSTRPGFVFLSMRNAWDLYFPSFFDLPTKGSFLASHESLISAIKLYVPIDRILIGGVGFSLNPTAFLDRFGLRYGVKGPGEGVAALIGTAPAGSTLRDLCGGRDTFVFDMRSLGQRISVNRHYVDNARYYELTGQAAVRATSGCPMRCSYCAEPVAVGNTYLRSDIVSVLRELDQLVEMGINDIQTADSEFNMPFAYSKQLLTAIADRKYGKDLRLWLYCQPRPFDSEYATLLQRAGVWGVNFGTDHSDPDTLTTLGKWYSTKDIELATALCRDNGIAVMHELLFGSPGDSPDRMYRAIEQIQAMNPRVIGVSVGLAVVVDTPLGRMLASHQHSKSTTPEFFCAGTPMVDPSFFLNDQFHVPEVFEDLQARWGSAPNIMLPTLNSTGRCNNQLVNSDRVRYQTRTEKRKGPSWYHFTESSGTLAQAPQPPAGFSVIS